MNEFLTVLGVVLPVFGVMAIGLFLRRREWLTAEADQSLLWLCINLLLPALIFDSVLGNAALRRPENLLLPPLVGLVMASVALGLAHVAARLAGLDTASERRTFAFTTGIQNYAYLAIPLCVMLFDPATTGVLFVHNIGVEMTLWTLGVAVLTGQSLVGGWRKLFNAPLVALLLALTLNALAALVTPPPPVAIAGRMLLTMVHWFGQSAIPLALLLVGAIVADHLAEARGGSSRRVIGAAVLVRLLIMPVLFLLVAKFLPCSLELKRVIVVQGAMPTAVLPIALARHYGGDTRTAIQVALGTAVFSLATIPLWIRFGGLMVGLW